MLGARPDRPADQLVVSGEQLARRLVEHGLACPDGLHRRHSREVLVARYLRAGCRSQEKGELPLGKAGAAAVRAQVMRKTMLCPRMRKAGFDLIVPTPCFSGAKAKVAAGGKSVKHGSTPGRRFALNETKSSGEGPVEKVWAMLNNDGPLPRQRKVVQEESGRPARPMGQRNQMGPVDVL